MEEQCGFIWCMERGTVVGAGTIAIGELEGRGHAVIAIDLPGLGEDRTPPARKSRYRSMWTPFAMPRKRRTEKRDGPFE
jgi:hypothetical protein